MGVLRSYFVPLMTSQVTGELQVDVLDDVASWDALEPEWGELFEASPTASPPLRWEWLRQWWRVYGPVYGGRGLRIVTVRRGGHLIGALPLYLHIGHRSPVWAHYLGFLSTGESRSGATWPEYLDLLHAPGEARTCLDAMLPALLDPAVGRWTSWTCARSAGARLCWAGAIRRLGTSGSW